MKRKERAINALREYIGELDPIANVNEGNTWKAKVHHGFVLYVGAESSLTKRLERLYFTDAVTRAYSAPAIGVYTEHVYNPANKRHFEELINSAIQHIQHNGVVEDYIRTNFLSQFNTTQILGGIIVAGGIVFSAGLYTGNVQKDRELITTERERDEAKANYTKLVEENNKQLSAQELLKANLEMEKVKYSFLEAKYDSLKTSSKERHKK